MQMMQEQDDYQNRAEEIHELLLQEQAFNRIEIQGPLFLAKANNVGSIESLCILQMTKFGPFSCKFLKESIVGQSKFK